MLKAGLSAGVIAVSCHVAAGATIHVPGDFATIQGAISDAATVDGDVIVVAPGTYPESIDLLGKEVTIRSADPGDPAVVTATVIDAGGLATAVRCASGEGPGTVLEGLTLSSAGGPVGSGLLVEGASPTLLNCVFIANSASMGGGICVRSSSAPLILSCTFLGNAAATSGGGLYVDGTSAATVTNCVFSGNLATRGGAVASCGSGSFANCSMSANLAFVAGGAVYACARSSLVIANSIAWGNFFDQVALEAGAAPAITHSDIQGGFAGAGNIDAGPAFLDADGPDGLSGNGDDDLRLAPGSPSIDAGDNLAVPPDATDMDVDGDTAEPVPFDRAGAARFTDDAATTDTGTGGGGPGIVDMGAFEFASTAPPSCSFDIDGDEGVGITDLLELLSAWGQTDVPADFDGGGVGITDLISLLSSWGPCPAAAGGPAGPAQPPQGLLRRAGRLS